MTAHRCTSRQQGLDLVGHLKKKDIKLEWEVGAEMIILHCVYVCMIVRNKGKPLKPSLRSEIQ